MEKTSCIIEEKKYDETCSQEVRKALLDRVWISELGIVYLKEIPTPSPFTLKLMLDQIKKLGAQFEQWGLIIDLRQSKRPDARARRTIVQGFIQLSDISVHTSFIVPGKLLTTAIHFVMFGIKNNSYSVCHDLEKAKHDIKQKLYD